MAQEMTENQVWESDEDTEGSEFDEAIAETEDESAEDIGERVRRRRRLRGRPIKGGAQGIRLPAQDGRGVRDVRFPAPLATVAATNRGLASQELARRAVESRVGQLENSMRVQQKRNASVAGAVTLTILVGLTGVSIFNVVNKKLNGPDEDRKFTELWVAEDTAKAGALTAATQLATTAAKGLVNRRYDRSTVGIIGDVVATGYIAVLGAAFAVKKFGEKNGSPRR
jgi:hypothetical protein